MTLSTSSSSNGADKLIQVKRLAAQKRLKLSIAIFGLGILLILLMVWLSGSGGVKMSVQKTAIGASTVLQRQSNEDARQVFLQRYSEFTESYQVILDNQLIQAFDPSLHSQLVAQQQQSLALFAQSAFQSAADEIQALINATAQLNVHWQQAHAEAIEEANKYYFEGKINRATLAFQHAVELNPKHSSNNQVQARLASFETINSLQSALAVAQTENNLNKQKQLLSELMQLPDQFNRYRSEFDRISDILDEQKLSKLLLQAREAIAVDKPQSAVDLVSQAKQIDPNAAAIAQIETELNRIRIKRSKTAWLSQLAQQQANDAWQKVIVDAQTAASQFPDEAKFEALARTATDIVYLQRRLSALLQQPQRLSDTGLREQATLTVQKALPLSLRSPALAEQINRLGQYIDQYQTGYVVTIESDGLSDIQIVGIGNVGRVLSKTIQLTPGAYTLEAKRTGYKTKRTSLTVSEYSGNTIFIANDEEI